MFNEKLAEYLARLQSEKIGFNNIESELKEQIEQSRTEVDLMGKNLENYMQISDIKIKELEQKLNSH